jgi:hypothetical protein
MGLNALKGTCPLVFAKHVAKVSVPVAHPGMVIVPGILFVLNLFPA